MRSGARVTAKNLAGEPVALTPILSAALDSFDEHSYHGATVRDIARRVGMTVPALYYHHENKEAMLYDLLDASILRLEYLCQQADNAILPTDARFDALVGCLVRYTAASKKLSRLDHEIRSLSPAHRHDYSVKRSAIERRLLAVVKQGSADGSFTLTQPADTVRALLGMVQAITTWYDVGGRMSIDVLVKRYLDISRRMVGAS